MRDLDRSLNLEVFDYLEDYAVVYDLGVYTNNQFVFTLSYFVNIFVDLEIVEPKEIIEFYNMPKGYFNDVYYP